MSDRSGEERLLGGYEGRLFLGISIGWFLVVFGRQLLPPLLPAIIDDMDITSFQAGIALTALLVMRALNQYPGGRLADQLTRKTVLVGSLAVVSVGLVLLSVTFAYPLLLVAVGTVGIGAGAYSVATRATTADFYLEKRGQAFGVQGAFLSIAGVGSAGVAVLALAYGTWRSAFLPIVAVLVALIAAIHLWSRDPYVLARVEFDLRATSRRVFGGPQVRLVIGAYLLTMFAWLGMIGFLPTFLHVEKGLSTAIASAGFGLVYLVGVVFGPLAGVFGDRYGKLETALAATVLGTIGLAALLWADSLALVGVAIAVIAAGFWSFFPLAQAYLMDNFTDGTMAGDLGVSKTLWGGVGSFGPAYVGFMGDWRSFTVGYLGLVVCLVGALLVLTHLWRSER